MEKSWFGGGAGVRRWGAQQRLVD